MPVRVGEVLFDDWVSLRLPGGWSDTFIFRLSPTAALPPMNYAYVIRPLISPVRKLRSTASIWVQISAGAHTGSWYGLAVRKALHGLRMPFAVTGEAAQVQIQDFSFHPWADEPPMPRPPAAEPYLKGSVLPPTALGCLRVLARSDCATTAEVGSLGDCSVAAAEDGLQLLAAQNLVGQFAAAGHRYWKIFGKGTSVALRSWGVPPGFDFRKRRERGRSACRDRGYAEEDTHIKLDQHRRIGRNWPARVRQAWWPQVAIWAGWTEVNCRRTRPDALCWGTLAGVETLFWMEAERGNASIEDLKDRIVHRFNRALVYAREFEVRLVFVLHSPRWVRRELVTVFRDLPDDSAVVVADWKVPDRLPIPAWGIVRWVA